MSDRAIIVLEGSEYVGKTSVAQSLQKLIPNHSYIKLSQPRSLTGKDRIDSLMETFVQTVKLCETMNNHIIIDRFTTSERVYGPMYHGFDNDIYWRFNHIERRLNNVGAHHFLLCAKEAAFVDRWNAKIAMYPNEVHISPEESLKVQEQYFFALDEIKYDANKIHFVDTTDHDPLAVAKTILRASGLGYLLNKGNGALTNAP